MYTREQSIKRLKQGLENKVFGVYNNAKGCRYYDYSTESCCAVGYLLGDKIIENAKENRYNIESFTHLLDANSDEPVEDDISSQLNAMGRNELFGLLEVELRKLQEYHDRALQAKRDEEKPEYERNIKLFEKLINEL